MNIEERDRVIAIWWRQLAQVQSLTESREAMLAIQVAVETCKNPTPTEIEVVASAYKDHLMRGGPAFTLRHFVQATHTRHQVNLSYDELFVWLAQEATHLGKQQPPDTLFAG